MKYKGLIVFLVSLVAVISIVLPYVSVHNDTIHESIQTVVDNVSDTASLNVTKALDGYEISNSLSGINTSILISNDMVIPTKLKFSAFDGKVEFNLSFPIELGTFQKDELLGTGINSTIIANNYNYGITFNPTTPDTGMNAYGGLDFVISLNRKPSILPLIFAMDNNAGILAFLQPSMEKEWTVGEDLGGDVSVISVNDTTVIGSDGQIYATRPISVVNSIAFYCNESGDYSSMGGTNYMTGKIGMLYRMKAVDSCGHSAYMDWSINGSNIILTDTTGFLQKAIYPVTIQPLGDTFGYMTAGASSVAISSAGARGSVFPYINGTAVANSFTFYVGNGTSTRNAKAMLVLNSSLVLVTNGVGNPVSCPNATDWRTSTFSTPPVLINNTNYVLMAIASGSLYFYYDTGSVNQGIYDNSNNYTTPTNLVNPTYASRKYSIYCSYVLTPDYLTLAASPIAGGIPTTNITNPVVNGSIALIYGNASSCYTFSNWTPTTNISDPNAVNTSVTIYSNMTITANYNIKTYTLTYVNGSNGGITGTLSQTVNCSANGSAVAAVPNACYHFTTWNDSSVVNPRTDTNVLANASYMANFVINTSTITYVNGSGGGVTGTLSQTINCGSYTTAVMAVPNACYAFINWSDANTSVSRTDLGTSTNQSFTANFAINTSTITYSAGAGGSIVGSTPQTINCGTSTTSVTATPNACYHFTTWSDANTSAARTDIGTSTNQTFTASFAIDIQTVNYSVGAGGTVNDSWPQNVNCGSNSNWVLATPNSCYHFVNWNDSSVTNPRQETNVTSNLSFVANFAINTSTITYVAGANGTLNNSVPQTIDCGADTTDVLAISNACYHFVDWDDASTDNPRHDTGTSTNQSFTANFDIDVQTVEYIAGANGAVNGSWPENVNCGDDSSWVLATADPCYHFVNWSNAVTDNPRQDTNVTSNISLTANFAIDTSTITYSADLGGSINGATPQTINCGTYTSEVTVVPDSSCYYFLNWSEDGNTSITRSDIATSTNQTFTATFGYYFYNLSVVANNSCGNPYYSVPDPPIACGDLVLIYANTSSCCTFSGWTPTTGLVDPNAENTSFHISGDIVYTAHYIPKTYTLTYTNGSNGTIIGDTPQTITCGADGTPVTAIPDACYHFFNWSDSKTDNPRTDINVLADITVTANFSINTYNLSYTAGSHGSIIGNNSQTVNCGINGSMVTANPSTCYHFINWSDSSVVNPRTDLNVSGNITVTANFGINVYTITYIAGTNGSISGVNPQTINCGSDGTAVTANPDPCYHFVNWSDGSVANPRTDLNVNGNHSYTAYFAVSTYNLSLSASPAGGGSPTFTGSNPFNCSDIVDIFANPNAGYSFTGWTPIAGINDSTLADANVSMTQNRSLVAHFTTNIQPPTNLSVITNGNLCFNMSWTMGVNATATTIVMCRESSWDCADTSLGGNISDCWVAYNGSGTTFNSCGIDLDLFNYSVTAWGTVGGIYSTNCAGLTIGGASMVQMMYWWLGIGFAVVFFGISFWQRQWWLFITNGIIWFILMAFAFTQYTTADMMYWFGYVFLIMAIICIGCVFWFRERHETINPDVEESQDEKREKRSKKLSGLRNLANKIKGKDY